MASSTENSTASSAENSLASALDGARWLQGRRLPRAALRLYCFSHAGGNAGHYLPWQERLGAGIELRAVQLPARGARLREPPYLAMAALVRDLAAVLAADHDGRPFAFFGHSMGALVAFELARFLRGGGQARPVRLVVSGSAAPWRRAPLRRLHELSDDLLVDALRELGGTPPEVLAEPDLRPFLLPAVRADFALVADYRCDAAATRATPLDIPLTVLAGRDDAGTSADNTAAWGEAGSAGCAVHWYDGGHFFVHEQTDAVLALLRSRLA